MGTEVKLLLMYGAVLVSLNRNLQSESFSVWFVEKMHYAMCLQNY